MPFALQEPQFEAWLTSKEEFSRASLSVKQKTWTNCRRAIHLFLGYALTYQHVPVASISLELLTNQEMVVAFLSHFAARGIKATSLAGYTSSLIKGLLFLQAKVCSDDAAKVRVCLCFWCCSYVSIQQHQHCALCLLIKTHNIYCFSY